MNAVARHGPSPNNTTATNRLRRLKASVSAPTSKLHGAPSRKNAIATSPEVPHGQSVSAACTGCVRPGKRTAQLAVSLLVCHAKVLCDSTQIGSLVCVFRSSTRQAQHTDRQMTGADRRGVCCTLLHTAFAQLLTIRFWSANTNVVVNASNATAHNAFRDSGSGTPLCASGAVSPACGATASAPSCPEIRRAFAPACRALSTSNTPAWPGAVDIARHHSLPCPRTTSPRPLQHHELQAHSRKARQFPI